MALIWGGMLMVMAPLYSTRTQSPQEKQRAWSVCTSTLCRVSQSHTSRVSQCTHRTLAHRTAVIAVFSKDIPPIQFQCMRPEGNGFREDAFKERGDTWRD